MAKRLKHKANGVKPPKSGVFPLLTAITLIAAVVLIASVTFIAVGRRGVPGVGDGEEGGVGDVNEDAHTSAVGGGGPTAVRRRNPTLDNAMLDWLDHNGAEYHVKVRSPKGGERGVYAARRLARGDAIARIPVRLTIISPPDVENDLDQAELLAKAGLNRKSHWSPWLNALPMLHSHLHTATCRTLPREYWHLIKSEVMEEYVASKQQQITEYWEKHGRRLLKEGVSLERLQAAVVTKSTRQFLIEEGSSFRTIMVPLVDFANYVTNCSNYWEFGRCTGPLSAVQEDVSRIAADQLCVIWKAGGTIEKGQEACINYGHLTPDKAWYVYGFILTDDPPDLSLVDVANASLDHMRSKTRLKDFDGPPEALESELARVRGRIEMLEGAEEEEAATQVAPSDPGGYILESMKRLRQQRSKALRNEAGRLRALLESRRSEAEEVLAGSSSGGHGGEDGGTGADPVGEGVSLRRKEGDSSTNDEALEEL